MTPQPRLADSTPTGLRWIPIDRTRWAKNTADGRNQHGADGRSLPAERASVHRPASAPTRASSGPTPVAKVAPLLPGDYVPAVRTTGRLA